MKENAKLRYELELICETFKLAIQARESKGGQHVPYFGDFCSVPPSTIKQMEWWVKRWETVLEEDETINIENACEKCNAGIIQHTIVQDDRKETIE